MRPPARSLQTYNGKSGREAKENHTWYVFGGDNKEVPHITVSCVGLFGDDGGKDHY